MNYPTQYESRITLKNGKEIYVRPIIESDAGLIVDLFQKSSAHSRYKRFLRRLDAIPEQMLYRFTHIDYNKEFALVGIVSEGGKDSIIAVARYAYSPDDHLPELAVAVRDDWQNLRLGKELLQKVVEIGKEHGIDRFGGMIDPQNKVIRQILKELGYQVNYTLKGDAFQVEIVV